MKIEIEDATGLAAQDIHYLSDDVVRFRLKEPRDFSPSQELLRGEREAAALDETLAQLTGSLLALRRPIRSRADLLTFYLDHFCRPTYLFTSGSAIISVVERSSNCFEVLFHPYADYFDSFGREYSSLARGMEPEFTAIVSTYNEAEAMARKRLATVTLTILQLRKGSEVDTLSLRPQGPKGTRIASFRGQTFRWRIGGYDFEPYRILNELRPDGFTVEACATCSFFRFSGMTRDMSAGSAGYCAVVMNIEKEQSNLEYVSVMHYCPEYSHIEDRDRKHPYIRISRAK